jgi:long-chain fatty acid transport protein
MRRVVRIIALLAVGVSIPWSCFAAGFSIFEAGAKALGMGGAFTAQADDPSAIFFNAAGIADLQKTQLYLGVSTIFTGTSFAGVEPDPGYGTTGETGTMVFPPFNAYITYQFQDGLTGGFGVFNAYGLGQHWDDESTFPGRHISHTVDLKTFYFNPTLAWRPYEKFALGGGVQAVYSTVNLERYIQQYDPNGSGLLDVGTVKLEGNSSLDWGGNVGVLAGPFSGFTIGVAFRSQVEANVTGDATFTQISSGSPQFDDAVAAVFPANQGVETTVNLPWLLSMAGVYRFKEKWTVEVDFNYFGWSEFQSLEFRFDEPDLNTVRPQNYDDVLSIRSGLQYALTEEWDLRGGYYWDPTPQPTEAMSPLLADTDRHGISLGFGYGLETWVIDVFGLALLTEDRSTEGLSLDGFNGDYGSFAFLAGVNVGYEF